MATVEEMNLWWGSMEQIVEYDCVRDEYTVTITDGQHRAHITVTPEFLDEICNNPLTRKLVRSQIYEDLQKERTKKDPA